MTESFKNRPEKCQALNGGVIKHAQPLTPDRAAIRQHLELLAPDNGSETLEVASGKPEDGPKRAERFTCNQLDEAADFAEEQNMNGYNVYVGAAPRKQGGKGRAKFSEFAGGSFLWVDADDNVEGVDQALTAGGLRPAFVVQTGSVPEARKHYYFHLNGSRQVNVDEVRKGNRTLQVLLGTDAAVVNPIQLLRLAGTINYPTKKKISRGYIQEITILTEFENSNPVDVDQLSALTQRQGQPSSKTLEKVDASQKNVPPIAEVVKLLKFISPKDYGQWISIGMAIKHTYGDEGFEVWDFWSKGQDAKYYPKESEPTTRYKWKSFDASNVEGAPVTLSTILYLARKNGWKGNLVSSPFTDGRTPNHNDQDGVRLYSIDELMDRQPPEFLIDSMFPAKGVAIIGGQSGTMKSFMMIYLSIMVALGKNIGHYAVKQTGVLFMINEGQAGFGTRCKAALTALKVDGLDNFRVAEVTPDLMREETLSPFFEAAEALDYKLGLIVIDTFSKASISGDDNSTSDMAKAIKTAEQLANYFGALVILIDHVGKDPKKGVRGAYSKYANAEMVGMVTKVSDTVTLKTTKQKEAGDNISFDFQVNLVEIPDKHTGEVREVPALNIRSEFVIPPQKDFIINILQQDGPTDRKELANKFCFFYDNDKKKSFNTQLNRLRKQKKITLEDGCVHLVV
jgi:hypothetical protein